MVKARSVAVAVIVIIAIFAGAWFGGLLSVGGTTDTATHSVEYKGVVGGGGNLNCLPSDSGCGNGAGYLMDKTQYIASYSPNQAGETIAIVGTVKLDSSYGLPFGSIGIGVTEFRVDVKLTTPDGTILMKQSYANAPNNQLVNFDKWYIESTPTGIPVRADDGKTIIPSGSVLSVTYSAHVWFLFLGPAQDQGWGIIATQNANVISGIGTVSFNNAHSDSNGGIYYIVGESASFTVTVGYTNRPDNNNPAWNAYIYSEASNSVVFGPVDVTQLTQTFSYTVRSSDFSAASPNNELVLQLRNELYNYAFKITAIVRPQDVAHMPTCTQPSISPQSPKQGQVVTLSFACSPATSADIDQIKLIKVEWGYGGVENTNVLSGNVTSWSFTAAQSGYVYVAITAYTVGNIPSGTGNYKIQIDHQETNQCSNGAAICNPPGPGIGIWVWLLLAGIVLIVITYFFLSSLPMWPWRLILYAIGVILIFIAVLLALYLL